MTTEFHDEDMRRAWAESAAEQRDMAANPERTTRLRQRLINWVQERTE